tara:strand:+ start:3942 stop:5522 length:1581 start_codon:yes stop_codon:yes gene_type:complete
MKTDFTTISPGGVRAALLARIEIALLDVREEADFARAHPLFAAQMALGNIELEAFDRIPRRDTQIILYDDGEEWAERAARIFTKIGYTDVRLLEGGLSGWRAAGYELFQDVNSYSKAFGELVEHRRQTPSIAAPDLQAMIDSGEKPVILDARSFDEYEVMNIPNGISTPGAELVLRARTAAPDPATPIFVNCAGRTRSLIGTQSLINAGIPNPVAAVRNGTIGWTLAGLTLEHGQQRKLATPDAAGEKEARRQAREVAYRAGVRHIDCGELAHLERDSSRTLYRFDVRLPDEYEAGHPEGFRNAPGGQLVQEIDIFAPVRGARIVLADRRHVRADMTASWLAQMGWDVYVLKGPTSLPQQSGAWRPDRPPLPHVHSISPDELAALGTAATIIDLAPSKVYRRGHLPAAICAIRSRVGAEMARLIKGKQVVLTSPDGALAHYAASEIGAALATDVRALVGGTDAWATQGRPLEQGWTHFAHADDDVYKRPYEGTNNSATAMQAYLDWEYGLVNQLAKDSTHGFFTIG